MTTSCSTVGGIGPSAMRCRRLVSAARITPSAFAAAPSALAIQPVSLTFGMPMLSRDQLPLHSGHQLQRALQPTCSSIGTAAYRRRGEAAARSLGAGLIVKSWRARHESGHSGCSAWFGCSRAGCSARLTSTCARRRPPSCSAQGSSRGRGCCSSRCRQAQNEVADPLGPRRLARDPAAERLHHDHLRRRCGRERLVLAPRRSLHRRR